MKISIQKKFEQLSQIYTRAFDAEFLNTSMLSVVRAYQQKNIADLEIWTFICAISNYQLSVTKNLIPMMTALMNRLNQENLYYIDLVYHPDKAEQILSSFQWGKHNLGYIHRFFRYPQLIIINNQILTIIKKYESLGKYIEYLYDLALNADPEYPLRYILKNFTEKLSEGLPPDFPRGIIPKFRKDNSTGPMKRLCLFFRWMVRPYPDLQRWNFFDPQHLLIPFDSGIKRVLQRAFKISLRKSAKLEDVLKTTRFLKEINPKDPVKYDFILSRPAIAGYCQKDKDKNFCYYCPLFELCSEAARLPEEGIVKPLSSKHESELFQRFLRLNIKKFDLVETEVPLGNRRADAVLHVKRNGIWVVEVENELNYTAVGQALLYKKLYEDKFNTNVEPVIICGKSTPDIERCCKLDAGIRVLTI
ncbi:MAG: DUF2400 domain-containing protein [Candidatus Lokiarchaeota archaeon]|nr:DUF2400 domain-containing protein [Candidatus Harpocratesius repetitus]